MDYGHYTGTLLKIMNISMLKKIKDYQTDLDLIIEKLGGELYKVDMNELFPNHPNARRDVLAIVQYTKRDNKPLFYVNDSIKSNRVLRGYVAILISAIRLNKLIDGEIFILFSDDKYKDNEDIIVLATEILMPTSLFLNLSELYIDEELAEIFFVEKRLIKLKKKLVLKQKRA